MKQTFIALSCLILATSACMHNTHQQNPEHKESLTIDQLLSKPIKDMSFNEACRVKKYYENQHQNDMVIKCADHMVSLATDQDETEKALLQLAELNMEEGKLDKAREHAENYQSLYPGTDKAEQALHIALKASYLSMLGSDRDQQPTEKTIELAQNYLDTYKEGGAYTDSVKDIMKNCYAQAIDSEIKVAQTYLAKYDYTEKESTLKAAEKRIEYIKDKLLAYNADHEPSVLEMEIKLAHAQNNHSTAQHKEKELAQKYPQYASSEHNIIRTLKHALSLPT